MHDAHKLKLELRKCAVAVYRVLMEKFMKVKLSASILSAVMFLVIVCPQAWGQPADSNSLVSLQDYLNLAAVNNAELRAEFEKWKAAIEEILQARSLSDPQLMYGYATEPTPQRSMFEVMQMFPWFGVLEDRTDAATAMAKSAGRQYEAKKLAVFYNVKDAFYEFSYLAKAIEITNENLQLTKHFEEVARTKYATAAASHPDIIRAQVELATLENDLISLEKSRPAVIAKLNSLLNRPAESNLPWPQAPAYRQVLIDFTQVYKLTKQNNPELQSMAYDIEAAKSTERLARKKFYPEFGIGVAVDAGMSEDMHSRTMPIQSTRFALITTIPRPSSASERQQPTTEKTLSSLKRICSRRTCPHLPANQWPWISQSSFARK